MNSFGGTSEIVEAKDELNPIRSYNGSNQFGFKLKTVQRDGKAHVYPVEDDLNRIIEEINPKTTKRVLAPSRHIGLDLIRERGMKKPVKLGLSQTSGKGSSEAITLKQALRRLCISQASEMAAMKRLSQPIGFSGVSEAGTIKRLYASVVVEANESALPLNDRRGTSVEVSLFPDKIVINSLDKASEMCQVNDAESSCEKEFSSSESAVAKASTTERTRIQGTIVSLSKKIANNPRGEVKVESRRKTIARGSQPSSHSCAESGKSSDNYRLKRPAFRKTIGAQKKGQREQAFTLGSSSRCDEISKVHTNSSCLMECALPSSGVVKSDGSTSIKDKDGDAIKPDFVSNLSNCREPAKSTISGSSRSREKGECSQSSKSSMGDYSSSTSISDESNQSVSRSYSSRPHMSKDVRWMAIHNIIRKHGTLGLKNFKLQKRLGCGDIGTVYLAELIGSECLFALKVMDNEFLMSKKKILRAQTEREILHMLDHPFLPTLYANFTSDSLSCLVMEYCPGGDLHILRQKQAGRSFSEVAARFYVAEVLLAIEYLHMLGVVYRDLKPENILIREDGHIMLSDFDLSLRCTVNPMLLSSSVTEKAQEAPEKEKLSGPCPESGCIGPLCLQPAWAQVSCFTPCAAALIKPKMHKPKTDLQPLQGNLLPQLVVEPTDARSNSFVGTYEYLAPEIIRGDGHGSAVDWWTFGIFLYELLFGRTPFKGSGNEETLANVVSQSLVFPESPAVSASVKDLITGLLLKEPEKRLGSTKGAAEIKQHPFFEGLNWALIRSGLPPETPKCTDVRTPARVPEKRDGKCLDFVTSREHVEFEIF